MTEAEVIDRINSTIKKNGKNAITGEEMNFVLKAIIQLIADSGGVINWGDIEGTIADQLDLASELAGKQDSLGYTPEDVAEKGAANGYAPLNASTKIDTAYFPDSIVGQLLYGGVVNATTAVATLTNSAKSKLGTASASITLTNDTTAITGYVANEGIYYIATTGGTFAGKTFEVGDWLVSIGSSWQKIDNTDAIASFNGRTGAITLTSGDVTGALGFTPAAQKYFTLSGQISSTITTTSGAVRYIGFSDNSINTVEVIRSVVLVDNSTIKNFFILTNSAQPATGSLVFTIQKNGTDTGIIINIPAGSPAGVYSETTTSVAYNSGDTISIKVINNASTSSAFVASQSIGIL
jgi:hypothetical protein